MEKMNLVNIGKHVLYLTQIEFHFENSTAGEEEILASQQLFEILKTFKNSYFNELHTYQSLDYCDEYDEVTDERDSTDEDESIDEEESTDREQNIDDYNETQCLDIQSNFTLKEMEDIVEWVDEYPNSKIASINSRFRKVKHMRYIQRFREYIKANGTRSEKFRKIKGFMWNELYVERTIEKATIHDSDLEPFAIQKAREVGWDSFKASESSITRFEREHRIPSRRYNKLLTRIPSKTKTCSLKGL